MTPSEQLFALVSAPILGWAAWEFFRWSRKKVGLLSAFCIARRMRRRLERVEGEELDDATLGATLRDVEKIERLLREIFE